jgi:hypothetical protein
MPATEGAEVSSELTPELIVDGGPFQTIGIKIGEVTDTRSNRLDSINPEI